MKKNGAFAGCITHTFVLKEHFHALGWGAAATVLAF